MKLEDGSILVRNRRHIRTSDEERDEEYEGVDLTFNNPFQSTETNRPDRQV